MINFLRKLFSKQSQNGIENSMTDTLPKTKVICDDNGFQVINPNENVETVKWDEIIKVSVITTDQGPVFDDVF